MVLEFFVRHKTLGLARDFIYVLGFLNPIDPLASASNLYRPIVENWTISQGITHVNKAQ